MNRNKRRVKVLYNTKLIAVSAGMLLFTLRFQSYGQDQEAIAEVKASSFERIQETRDGEKIELKAPEVQETKIKEDEIIYYQVPFGSLPEEIQEYTYEVCRRYEIPVEIVFAMMKRESKFDSKAVGDNGKSFGYMQIMKKWHEERMERLGVDDLMNPKENILVAVDYLSDLYKRYGDMTCALMAYNCGPSTAKKLWDSGVKSTKYSEEVLRYSEDIRKEIYGGEK